MKQWLLLILFLFLTTNISYAAGMLMRVQQMKQMKAQQQQEEYLAAYQQYQQNQQQNTQAQGQQAVAVQKTYQQTIDDRNQAIAQAISAQNQAAIQGQQQTFQSVAAPQVTSVTSPQASAPGSSSETGSSDVKDVVDLSEVWKRLDTKSVVWTLLIDDQAKVLTVSEYINRFSAQGVKITAPPEHYVQAIDQIAQQNPQMLQQPFGDVLKILAIVDYDFDNGMDKDMLAKQVLGESGFEQNKKRIADAQAQAQQAQQAQQGQGGGRPPGQ